MSEEPKKLTEQEALLCKVAGVKYRPPEIIERLTNASRVSLEAEPTNPFDPNAIKINDEQGNLIGYVPKKHTWILHALRRAGGVGLFPTITVNHCLQDEEKILLRVTYLGSDAYSFGSEKK